MSYWIATLDYFLKLNGRKLLNHIGKTSQKELVKVFAENDMEIDV